MTSNTTPTTLPELVARRAELFAVEFSPANSAALNDIEAKLDAYPWREVKAAIKAQKEAVAAPVQETSAA